MSDAQNQDLVTTAAPACTCCSNGTPQTVTVTISGSSRPGGNFDCTRVLTLDSTIACKWVFNDTVNEPRHIDLTLQDVGASTVRATVGVGVSAGYVSYTKDFAKPFDVNVTHDHGVASSYAPFPPSIQGGTARVN